MILCRDIHKSYSLGQRTIQALRGVDLHIAEPGFYAIMGQSGSGKSTLLHLLAALDRPDRGELWISRSAAATAETRDPNQADPVHRLDERAATLFRRKRMGIIFQQFNLIPTLSARENIELPGMLAGEDAKWLQRRSDELLDRLGVADRADHRPDSLSGGEQQRIAIARALLYAPPVILADEPTGNLDSVSAAKLWRLLRDIAEAGDSSSGSRADPSPKRTGACIVMVTHEPAAAVNCRRVYVLSDGRVTGQFDTEGLDAAGVATCYQRLVGTTDNSPEANDEPQAEHAGRGGGRAA